MLRVLGRQAAGRIPITTQQTLLQYESMITDCCMTRSLQTAVKPNSLQLLSKDDLWSAPFFPTSTNRILEETQILFKINPNDKIHKLYQFKSSENRLSLVEPGTGKSAKAPENEKKPDLEKISFELTYELTNLFVRKTDWSLYHPNMVFQENIRSGKRIEGLLNYIKFVNLLRILAHIKFVYVRFHVLNLTKHPEDGTIRIRWRIAGLGVTRLVLRYIPDQMWKRGYMDSASPSWYDGYSVFYVGGDNKIYKHIADKRMPDEEKKEKSIQEGMVDKLKKLKPTPAPSPAL